MQLRTCGSRNDGGRWKQRVADNDNCRVVRGNIPRAALMGFFRIKPGKASIRPIGVFILVGVVLVAGIGLVAFRPRHSAGIPIARLGKTVIPVPNNGTLTVPASSITPGVRVMVQKLNLAAVPPPDRSFLSTALKKGTTLSASSGIMSTISAGMPFKLATSTPNAIHGPMTLTFPVYGRMIANERPTISTYDVAIRGWIQVPSTYDAAHRKVSAQISHFSFWVASFSFNALAQAIFQDTGIANSGLSCTGPQPPNWLNYTVPPTNKSIQACVQGASSQPNVVDIQIRNNRNYPQWVSVGQSPTDWWESGGYNVFHSYAVRLSKIGITQFGDSRSMLLAPNATMAIGFTRGSWTNLEITTASSPSALAAYTISQTLPLEGLSYSHLLSTASGGSTGMEKCFLTIPQIPLKLGQSFSIDSMINSIGDVGNCILQVTDKSAPSTLTSKWRSLGGDLARSAAIYSATKVFANNTLLGESMLGLNNGSVALTDVQKTLPKAPIGITSSAQAATCTAGAMTPALNAYYSQAPHNSDYKFSTTPICRGSWAIIGVNEFANGQLMGPDNVILNALSDSNGGTAWKVSFASEGYPCSEIPAAALQALGTAAGCIPTPPAVLPVLTVPLEGSLPDTFIRPAIIVFSGDATNVVSHITWSSWTATGAVGHGTWKYLNCMPSCATGSETPYPATLILSQPIDGTFTQINETTLGPEGSTIQWIYPNRWPTYSS